MLEYRLIDPVDVLFLRGNRLFGEAGEHGENQMPPRPSVFAGAVASRILADRGRISEITRDFRRADAILAETAGEDYACVFLALARDNKVYLPLPSDLVALEDDKGLTPHRLRPRYLPKELRASAPLPMVPVLTARERTKPLFGIWLDLEGWRRHLAGEVPDTASMVKQDELWKVDSRLGIARDHASRTASEGRIYTTEGVALADDCRFLAGFSGNNIPDTGLLRLGGDGRGAVIGTAEGVDDPRDLGRPGSGWSGFRLILITPGIFSQGWLPSGCRKEKNGQVLFRFKGVEAQLAAAAIGRQEVVSGWDLAKHEPKPARKVVQAGSVYWFKVMDGNTTDLEQLWKQGLCAAEANSEKEDQELAVVRRREGFGRAWFGVWQDQKEV